MYSALRQFHQNVCNLRWAEDNYGY